MNMINLVMNPDLYQAPWIGRAIRVGRGDAAYWAFAPEPVLREVTLSPRTVFLLSEADRALGELAGIGVRLPNPHLLIQPYLRREAVASTRIEGTQSTLSEVLSAEAQLRIETEDQREVLNYVRALEYGLARLPELPLSKRLIRDLHGELLRAHFQFETIHPFLDGNGRLGRLLIVFYLTERRLLRQPLLYLSGYFEQRRDAYVDALQGVRERGDIDGWLSFFLEGVALQARSAAESADSLLTLRDEFRERLRRVRARGQAVDAAEALIGNPFVSAPRLAGMLGITRQGAQYVLSSLQRAGIVESVPGQARPALFVAGEVLAVLERD